MADENIPTLLELDFAELKVSEGKPSKGIRFHRVSLGGKAVQFLLHAPGTFTTVPWKPSVFGGTGDEPRLNLQINISDEQREAIENLEELVRDKLGIHASNWNSAVKPTDHGGLLKAKLNISGSKATAIVGEETKLPTDWPREANLFIKISTIYDQGGKASGLLLEIAALEIGQQQKVKSSNPFKRR